MLPVALDAMGGDRAPGEIVAGARQAAEELGIPVLLVGDPRRLGDTGDLPVLRRRRGHRDARRPRPGRCAARRTRRWCGPPRRSATARASAMVSAGNTGATMASALFRMGRLPGVARPAIATPIPCRAARPTVLLDAGANAECLAAWLVQFAQMGAAFARAALRHRRRPGSACCRSARRRPRATRWSRRPTPCWRRAPPGPASTFIGNVEGRDIMTDAVDVVVTDGFTGNVALKALEGGLQVHGRRRPRGVRLDGPEVRSGGAGAPRRPRASRRRARPRHLRRGRAARRGRGVHHQPRLVVGPGDRQRRPGGARRRRPTWSAGSGGGRRQAAASATGEAVSPVRPARVGAGAAVRPDRKQGAGLPIVRPSPSTQERSCPPRPMSNEPRSTASRCSS